MYGNYVYGNNVYADYGGGSVIAPKKVQSYAGRGISPSSPARPKTPTRTGIIFPSLGVAGSSPEGFSTEWLYGYENAKRFILRLEDQFVYRVWPTGLVETEIMYLKNQVQFEGTEASPETFTTGSGKLALMETGLPYPSFDDANWVFHVSVNGAKYQEANISIVKDSVQVVAGNLQFQAYFGYQGNAATDGNYWGDVAIILQEIP